MTCPTPIRDLLWIIFQGGDDEEQGGLLAREDGKITLVALFTLFFFAFLTSLVANVGLVVNRKIALQNTADAVALSCSVQRARTLNAVTAVNHMTGELLAIVVLHEAIGGKQADYQQEGLPALPNNNDSLTAQVMAVKALEPTDSIMRDGDSDYAYADVSKAVKASNALKQAHQNLRDSLSGIYQVETAGLDLTLLKEIPFGIGAGLKVAGEIIYYFARALEDYVQAEWDFLDYIRTYVGEPLCDPVDQLYQAIPGLSKFTREVLDRNQEMLTQTAKGIGESQHSTADVFPRVPSLPLEPEKFTDDQLANDGYFGQAQVVRATYPWVNYHRVAVMRVTRWMVFSKFPQAYRDAAKSVTISRCRAYYGDASNWLYVIGGSNPQNKGREPFTTNQRLADEYLCVVGFVHQPPLGLWSRALFPGAAGDGNVAFAQAMVYNANLQTPSASARGYQPEVGWDTINWQSPVAQNGAVQWPTFKGGDPCPLIKLNWQAKLVPASRLREAAAAMPAPFASILSKLDPGSPLAWTH